MGRKRTYRCGDCGIEFNEWVDSKDAPLKVDCPECNAAAPHDPVAERRADAERMATILATGQPPSKGGSTMAKAVNFTQAMLEESGHTDFNSARAGEAAFKPDSPMQTAERDAITQQIVNAGGAPSLTPDQASMVKGFWQPGAGRSAAAGAVMEQSKGGAAQARAMGVDPMAIVHAAGKKGMLGPKYDIVGREKMPAAK